MFSAMIVTLTMGKVRDRTLSPIGIMWPERDYVSFCHAISRLRSALLAYRAIAKSKSQSRLR